MPAPYPVCCIEAIPIPLLEKFLNEALFGSERLVDDSDYELGIVTASDDGSAPFVPATASRPPFPSSFSPFIASSAEDASHYVGEAEFFVVLDKQSLRDDTATMVARQKDGAVQTFRVTFDSAQHLLIALDVATIGFEEIQAIADSSGGVYGFATEGEPQEGGPAPRKKLGT